MLERNKSKDTAEDARFIAFLASLPITPSVFEVLPMLFSPSGFDPVTRHLYDEYVLIEEEKFIVNNIANQKFHYEVSSVAHTDGGRTVTKSVISNAIITDTISKPVALYAETTVYSASDEIIDVKAFFKGKSLDTYSMQDIARIYRLMTQYFNFPNYGMTSQDNLDVKDKCNGKSIASLQKRLPFDEDAWRYLFDKKTLVAAFFGLPTYIGHIKQKQSGANIGRQFIGWNLKRNIVWNLLLMPVFFSFNLLTMLPKILSNMAMLILLMTVGSLYGVSKHFAQLAIWRTSDKNHQFFNSGQKITAVNALQYALTMMFYVTLILVTHALASLFFVVLHVGGTVIYPIRNMRVDWESSQASQPHNPWLNLVIRIGFASIRLLTIAAVYGLAAVFLAPLLAPLVTPFIIAHAPLWLLAAYQTGLVVAGSLTQFVVAAIPILSAVPAVMVETFALAALLSAGIALVGSLMASPINRFGIWLHREEPEDSKADEEQANFISTDRRVLDAGVVAPPTSTPTPALTSAAAPAVAPAAPAVAPGAEAEAGERERLQQQNIFGYFSDKPAPAPMTSAAAASAIPAPALAVEPAAPAPTVELGTPAERAALYASEAKCVVNAVTILAEEAQKAASDEAKQRDSQNVLRLTHISNKIEKFKQQIIALANIAADFARQAAQNPDQGQKAAKQAEEAYKEAYNIYEGARQFKLTGQTNRLFDSNDANSAPRVGPQADGVLFTLN